MLKLYPFSQICKSLLIWGLLCYPIWGFSQAQIEDSCTLINYQPIGGHAIYLDNLPGATSPRFIYDSLGAPAYFYTDSTLQVTGIVQHEADPNKQWQVNIWLKNITEYADWTAMGRGFKIELAPDSVVNANVTDWVFFELDDTRSSLTGVPGTFYAGDTLNLFHRPSNIEFGFQAGEGANAKNGDFGISGWFFYMGSYSGIGDLNASFDCDDDPGPECDVSIDTAIVICDSSSASFTVELQVSGSGGYVVADVDFIDFQVGAAGTYTFGPYPDSMQLSFVVIDTLDQSCGDETSSLTANCSPPNLCTLVGEIDSVQLIPICVSDDSFQVIVAVLDEGIAEGINSNMGGVYQGNTPEFYQIFGNYANGTEVTFEIFNTDEPSCNVFESISADCLQDTCAVGIDSVYAVCTSNDSFNVFVNFSGIGNNFSVYDNYGVTTFAGVSPGWYELGPFYDSSQVFVTVIDSNFVDCNDTQGPILANCDPQCELSVDSAYTQCKTDSTYEVVMIISGNPASQDGFLIFDLPGSVIFPDSLFNVFADTVAYGEYPNGSYASIIVEDLAFDQGLCFIWLDSLTYNPDSSGVCNTSNLSGVNAGISNEAAAIQSNSVEISWTSSSMEMETYFLIERRTFSGPYTVVGKVEMEARQAYTGVLRFIDRKLDPSSVYTYRIKEVRPDGVKAYSETIQAMIYAGLSVNIGQVYPNPTDGQTNILISSELAQRISCDLFDQRGSVVAKSDMKLIEGLQELKLPTEELAAGLYLVKFSTDAGEVFVRKILITK